MQQRTCLGLSSTTLVQPLLLAKHTEVCANTLWTHLCLDTLCSQSCMWGEFLFSLQHLKGPGNWLMCIVCFCSYKSHSWVSVVYLPGCACCVLTYVQTCYAPTLTKHPVCLMTRMLLCLKPTPGLVVYTTTHLVFVLFGRLECSCMVSLHGH